MRLPTTPPRSGPDVGQSMTTAAHHAVLAAAVSASLLTTPFPALAAPSINDAIVEVSDSSYPVLKSLKAETFVPFSEKIGKLFLDINPDKLGRSVGLGIDVFTSAPPEKIGAFGGVVKDAFADLKPDSCTLVPLPSAGREAAALLLAASRCCHSVSRSSTRYAQHQNSANARRLRHLRPLTCVLCVVCRCLHRRPASPSQ